MLYFIEGFDNIQSAADLALKGWVGNPSGAGTTNARNGQALTLASSQGVTKNITISGTQQNLTTLIMGFALRAPVTIGWNNIALFNDAGTAQLTLQQSSLGLRVVRGATTLATSTGLAFAQNAYNYIEWQATIHLTAGAFSAQVNGVAVTWDSANTGVNTRGGTANNYANQVTLASSLATQYFDDLYLADTSGTVNNTFLGDVKVETLYPNGAGTNTQWTPNTGSNFAAVNEAPPNGDTTYVSASIAGKLDSYTLSDLVTTVGNVLGLQVNLYQRKDDAGTRQIAPLLRSTAIDVVGTTITASTAYQIAQQLWQVDPSDTNPWTITKVNALEAGEKLIA